MKKPQDRPWRGCDVNPTCDPSEAVFYGVLMPVVTRSAKDFMDQGDRYLEALEHLEGVNDDRVIALVCALLLENYVESCLKGFAPAFERMAEDREITFAVKTNFLRALQLIPPHLIDVVKPLRQIRNEFAHDLSTKTFEMVDEKYFRALQSQRQKLLPGAKLVSSRRELVLNTTRTLLPVLHTFERHLQALREFLSTSTFHRAFEQFLQDTADGSFPKHSFGYNPAEARAERKKNAGETAPK